ncbi:hypothetical protein BY996DRAFT_6436113 [Phakopsora pachyrhizi]|nr:hypothetical protein BY996DRAFT_6436113 [Phakopsora pachyrhizi]
MILIIGDRNSPFSQRTLFALEERGISYSYQEATDAQKKLDSNPTNPTDYLPFILYRDRVVAGGSVNLIQFLEEAFPNNRPNLLSEDLIERSRERLWSDYIRQYAVPLFVRSLRARIEYQRGDPVALASLGKVLDTYSDACIGPFFSGETLSLPDILIAPFISQARLSFFPRPSSDISRLIDSLANQNYQDYAKRLLDCDSLKRALPKKEVSLQDLEEHLKGRSSRISPPLPRLPPEIVSQIIENVGDYELAETLGVIHQIPKTSPWKDSVTPLDEVILRGNLSKVAATYSIENHKIFTTWGARVMIRFGYTDLLDYFLSVEPAQLHRLCDYILPDIASAWGRNNVLEWARNGEFGLPKHLPETPYNEATLNGHLSTLEWWKNSGLNLKIGNVMDFATMEGSTRSLDWWAKSGLEGKYSKHSLFYATTHGNIKVLDWWLASRLPLIYDKEVLVTATKHGQISSLDWWLKSGLVVYYTNFDIEEAIEDCYTQNQESVKEWWIKRGLDRNGVISNWSEVRILGRNQN